MWFSEFWSHFCGTMHCLPQRLKSTMFEIFFRTEWASEKRFHVDISLWGNRATTQNTLFNIFKWDQNNENHTYMYIVSRVPSTYLLGIFFKRTRNSIKIDRKGVYLAATLWTKSGRREGGARGRGNREGGGEIIIFCHDLCNHFSSPLFNLLITLQCDPPP